MDGGVVEMRDRQELETAPSLAPIIPEEFMADISSSHEHIDMKLKSMCYYHIQP
jgi:hypothetical protein